MADNWLEQQRKLIYPWDEGHPPPEGSHPTPFKPPSKDWARYQTNEYFRRLKAQLDKQVEMGIETGDNGPTGKYPTQEEADVTYQQAVSIINKEGFGSRSLVGAPNLFFNELIGGEWQESLAWAGTPVPNLQGVVKLDDKYYYTSGELLPAPYQGAAAEYYRQSVRQEALPQEMWTNKTFADAEKWAKMAEARRTYFDVQKEWNKALDTPWVSRPGETLGGISPERQLEIPERIWTDPNFQAAYGKNLTEIKKTEVYPYLRGGQLLRQDQIAQAEARVPKSTNAASEQMAMKRALEGYAPPTPMTGRAAGYVSPPMGESWVDKLAAANKTSKSSLTPNQKLAAAQNRARAKAREAKVEAKRKEFQGFASFMKGGKNAEYGAMSTAEQQVLMGEYEKKYGVKQWPTLPSGQAWYTMPFEQRGQRIAALTSGTPYFKKGETPSWMASYSKKAAKKAPYTSPEEVLYFMGLGTGQSSGIPRGWGRVRQRA